MTKPQILVRVDELLADALPSGIRAFADGTTMGAVLDYLDRLDEFDRRRWDYKGVTLALGNMAGWGAYVMDGFEKPDEQGRDPDTGRFLSYEDTVAAAGADGEA